MYTYYIMRKLTEKVREPLVNGLFYPDDPAELKKVIDNCETAAMASVKAETAKTTIRGKALAIVSPHAAYENCGNLIAAAFLSAADRKIDTVVLLGPVHKDHINEIILPEPQLFSIPGADFHLDEENIETLLSCSTLFTRSDIPHLEEHCL